MFRTVAVHLLDPGMDITVQWSCGGYVIQAEISRDLGPFARHAYLADGYHVNRAWISIISGKKSLKVSKS